MGLIKRIRQHRANKKAWNAQHAQTLAIDKANANQKPTYYGGSPQAVDQLRQGAQADKDRGQGLQDTGVNGAYTTAAVAQQKNDKLSNQFGDLANENKAQAGRADVNANTAWQGYQSSQQNYASGRQGILDSAAALDRSADNMATDYQRTDDMRRQADMEAAQRQALSAARSSGGGALAVRAALQSQAAANAQALQGAGVTRATETNNLLNMQNQARAQAAGIRTGLSVQDLQNSGLNASTSQGQSTVAQNARTLAGNNLGAEGALTQANVNNMNTANQLATNVGTNSFNVGQQTANTVNTNQLTADTQNAQAQAQNAMNDYLDEKDQKNPYSLKGKVISAIFDPGNIRGSDQGEWIGSTTV